MQPLPQCLGNNVEEGPENTSGRVGRGCELLSSACDMTQAFMSSQMLRVPARDHANKSSRHSSRQHSVGCKKRGDLKVVEGWVLVGRCLVGKLIGGEYAQDKLYTCMKSSNSKNILCKINLPISSACKFTLSEW